MEERISNICSFVFQALVLHSSEPVNLSFIFASEVCPRIIQALWGNLEKLVSEIQLLI